MAAGGAGVGFEERATYWNLDISGRNLPFGTCKPLRIQASIHSIPAQPSATTGDSLRQQSRPMCLGDGFV
jgi:hypothetical protein